MVKTRVLLIGLALLAALAPAAPARADYRFAGHGYGHGVGLAQWGAMGYARAGRTHSWILLHYFPGTARTAGRTGTMRVRLAESVAAEVSGATLAADARGRRVTISATRAYRFVAWERDGLEMIDIARHHTRAHLYAPVRLTGPSSLRLAGRAENGVTNGRYRGAIVLHRSDQRVLAVNEVGLERYLYGVVPAEMPSSWPAEALRSQAVAARSYALTSRRPAAQFDVYADTRSQMYRGVAGETTRTTDAVRGTKGVVLTAGGSIARTLFHSSSGGRTAAVEDAFGGPPVSYLRAVDDPYDTLSPHHDWTVTLTDEEARQRLASILQGTPVDIVVTARTPGGRAATVRVTGTLGTRDLSGATARSLLGLRSTWFEVRRATD